MEQVKRNNTYYHQKEADYERKYSQASYYKHYVNVYGKDTKELMKKDSKVCRVSYIIM